MKSARQMKKLFALLLIATLFAGAAPMPAQAIGEMGRREGDITDHCLFACSNVNVGVRLLTDSNYMMAARVPEETTIAITARDDAWIGGVYIEFETIPEWWSVTTDSGEAERTGSGFFHQYAEVRRAREITLAFSQEVILAEIYVVEYGPVPAWVEVWQDPAEKADLLIFPAHYDDDQLYFAGMIPWAVEQGAVVQVAYLVNHNIERYRKHEMLHALWLTGISNYPVLGEYEGLGRISADEMIRVYAASGISWDDLLGRRVELIRRFRPQVIATHSLTGEYGHGGHVLCQRLTVEAAVLSGKEDAFADSAEKYGAWAPLKLYVHNFEDGHGLTVLDLDAPLASFGGLSAYELSILGFECHPSQRTAFYGWLTLPGKAANIAQYSPCEWGLYSTRVGEDQNRDSLFEHITLYCDQEKGALAGGGDPNPAPAARPPRRKTRWSRTVPI